MKKRKICVVTGSRAEYGQLRPLLRELKKDRFCQLQLVATGMHLSREFGETFREIERDGFTIAAQGGRIRQSDTALGIAQSLGRGVSELAAIYAQGKPDMVVLLGDRFEILAAALAAAVSQIPVAHIHGGEVTQGVFDDYFRHAITKMAHLHFTSTQKYRRRVIQLGEDPRRVFNVGALALDDIRQLPFLSKEALCNELGIRFDKRTLVVTFHPVTLEKEGSLQQAKELLVALSRLKNTSIIFTKSNADTQGKKINALLESYVRKNQASSVLFSSLGQLRYLSLLRLSDAVVGNSSSGFLEAPYFKVPTVNVGDRQKGRVRLASIVDCKPNAAAIEKAIEKVSTAAFKRIARQVKNPYQRTGVARRIVAQIKKFPFDSSEILKKGFFDIKSV